MDMKFNDPMREKAAKNIVAFLQNPDGKSPLAQASLVLETVQAAFSPKDEEKDAQTNLVQFIGKYVDEFAGRVGENTPDFAKGIIPNHRNITVTDITQLLAKLRCLSVNQKHSDYIANHLTYFIDKFESEFGVSSIICKKFCISYSDYSDSITEVLHWGLKTFNPPIIVTFNSPTEWKNFRTVTEDEGRYSCKYNGVGLALSCKTAIIDKFDESKYPIEVRINGTQKTDERILNMSTAEIESIKNELRGLNRLSAKEFVNVYKTKLIIAAVALIAILSAIIIPPIVKENRRVKEELKQEINDMLRDSYEKTQAIKNEYPDSWMVGKWRTRLSSMYGTMIVTLEIDEYGNTFETIEYSNGGYERNSFKMYYDRNAQQLYFKDGALTTRYNVYTSSREFGDGDMMFRKY